MTRNESSSQRNCATAANLAAGALLFGQSMADRPSLLLAATGLALWVVLIAYAVHLVSSEETMTASLILMGGMALFATILVIIDEIGRRQKRARRGSAAPR